MDDQTHARVGDYEILGVLGAGGMGKVYKVRNVISDRVEAMKILLPDLADRRALADRFLREIKLLATLNHPNIAALRTALTWDNQLVMIMEYVEGVTLSTLLRRGPVSAAQAIDYMSQVLSALAYAHSLHIIHRDVKPANMMLTQQNVVKLMDFGIARSQGDPVLTQSGSTLGSLQYMSPEQVRGEQADERSDLYSIGVSLYELLTGQRPFRADNEYAVMLHHLQTPPPAPIEVRPDLPPALNDIVLMAMAKDPAHRFQSATAMRNALLSIGANVASSSGTPASPIPDAPLPGAADAIALHADDATGACASPPSAVIRAAMQSEASHTPVEALSGIPEAVPSAPPPSAVAPGSASRPSTAPSASPNAAPPRATTPPTAGAPQPPVAASVPQTPHAAPPAPIAGGQQQSMPAGFADMPPLPPRAPANRGLYIALGSVIVLVVLVAAGLYIPRMSRAHAGGDATRADRHGADLAKPDLPPTPPSPGNVSANAGAANTMAAVPPAPEVHLPSATDSTGTARSSSASGEGAKDKATNTSSKPPHSPARDQARSKLSAASELPTHAPPQQQALNTPPTDVPALPAPADNLAELEHDADLLASRAEAVEASLEGLRQNQASQGLGLRGDVASSQQRMRNYMARAQSALKNHDAQGAKKYLSLADSEVSSLEKFLGH